MSEGKQTQTEQEAPEQVNSSSLSQDWDDWLGQKPVKRRLTVSVKHRLILKLLRLRATRTTTGSNHAVHVMEQESSSVKTVHCMALREVKRTGDGAAAATTARDRGGGAATAAIALN